MSTNADIVMETEDGFKSIYLHWDGYPEHAFEVLTNYYTDRSVVEQMIELGDISVLDYSIECPEGHSFDNRIPGYSVFYHRDRGEDREHTKAVFCDTLNKCCNNSFTYLFTCDGQWKIV